MQKTWSTGVRSSFEHCQKETQANGFKKNEIFCLSVTVMRLGVTKALNMFVNQISIRSKIQYFGNLFTLLF